MLLDRQKTAKGTGSAATQGPGGGGVAASSALSPTVIVTLAGETVIEWATSSHNVSKAVGVDFVSHAAQHTATSGRSRASRIDQCGFTVMTAALLIAESAATNARIVVVPVALVRASPVAESTVTTAVSVDRQTTDRGGGTWIAHGPVGGITENRTLSPICATTLAGEMATLLGSLQTVPTDGGVVSEPQAAQRAAASGRKRANVTTC